MAWRLVGSEKWIRDSYDISASRTETKNQAADMPDRVDAMQKKWAAWAQQADVLPWPRDRK